MKFLLALYVALAVMTLWLGVLKPLIRMRRCTAEVEGEILRTRDENGGAGPAVLRYTYGGELYEKRGVNPPRRGDRLAVILLIDPKEPSSCMVKNKAASIVSIVIFALMAAFLIGMAVWTACRLAA